MIFNLLTWLKNGLAEQNFTIEDVEYISDLAQEEFYAVDEVFKRIDQTLAIENFTSNYLTSEDDTKLTCESFCMYMKDGSIVKYFNFVPDYSDYQYVNNLEFILSSKRLNTEIKPFDSKVVATERTYPSSISEDDSIALDYETAHVLSVDLLIDKQAPEHSMYFTGKCNSVLAHLDKHEGKLKINTHELTDKNIPGLINYINRLPVDSTDLNAKILNLTSAIDAKSNL